jgi:hypothetical protein
LLGYMSNPSNFVNDLEITYTRLLSLINDDRVIVETSPAIMEKKDTIKRDSSLYEIATDNHKFKLLEKSAEVNTLAIFIANTAFIFGMVAILSADQIITNGANLELINNLALGVGCLDILLYISTIALNSKLERTVKHIKMNKLKDPDIISLDKKYNL